MLKLRETFEIMDPADIGIPAYAIDEQTALKVVGGETVDKDIPVPVKAVTKANVAEYLK